MVASFPHDVRKTKPSNKKLVKDVAFLLYSLPAASAIPPWRGFFLAAAGQSRLWSSSAKRDPSPGAPAQSSETRLCGVGHPGPPWWSLCCEAGECTRGPRTGVSAHKADDLARGPRLFERSENMWGGLPRQDGTYSGSERTSPRPPGFRAQRKSLGWVCRGGNSF